MANTEEFLMQWRDTREGLIEEVERVPEDRLNFCATTEARSILAILQHVVESERALVGEICRDDTDLRRLFTRPPDGEVTEAITKAAMLSLLHSSLRASSEKIAQFGTTKLDNLMTRFDGQQVRKIAMLNFTLAHEMYHRGQLTVYQRLLGIEPALTEKFRQFSKTES
jgi:uncharacterized damage-inducible protein DinB